MAYYSKNGSGIDSSAYIYVQLQVTRTDYPTYSHFSVKSVAVSDTGTSSFIRGQVTTNQGGTSWTAATGWKDVSYNGTTTLATATFDVTRGASDKTAHIGAYAEGGGTGIYAGGTDYAWLDVTVPKVLAPNAPTGCSATYASDSQATVSWTNGTTDTAKPRESTLIERQTDGGSWVQVASVGDSATSFTDNGISANHSYLYRVRAKNLAGYSSYSTAGTPIYTTPAPPASVTLDKTSATTVQIDVTGAAPYATGYDIESTYDNGSTWATVASSTSMPYSATVGAGTVQFRVRSVRSSLESVWTLSASLVTITPPLAPTIVQAPANPTSYGDSVTIAWTPNHPDGSAQDHAEVKVTDPSNTSTTHTVAGTATAYTFTPNATGTWTAQVRTYGLDPSAGAWSGTISWGVYNPPAVTIDTPATDGTQVTTLPLSVTWTVTDGTGVSAQRIIISDSNGELLNRTVSKNLRAESFDASDISLENGGGYSILLRVMGGSGLVTEQVRTFVVAWDSPEAPVLGVREGDGQSAMIDVTYGEDGLATNLAPFFSHDITDVYNISTNPDGYWREMTATGTKTMLEDGWVNFTLDNTSDSSAHYWAFSPSPCPDIVAAETYTVLLEVRNVVSTITGTSENFVIPCYQAYQLNTTGNVKFGNVTDADYHAYRLTTTGNDPSSARLVRGRCYVYGNGYLSLDFRLSVYEGEYEGDYVPYGIPATAGVDVFRVNDDGSTWLVASGVADLDTAIDPLPPLGVPVTYKAVATSALGSTSQSEYSETFGGKDWVLNFGNAAQEFHELRYNPEASYSLTQGGTSYHFADGGAGGGRPVYYATTDRDESGALKFATIGKDDADRLRTMCDRYPVAWLRDPFGHRWRAHVKPSWSHGVGQLWPVGISWDAVRWTEAWDG